MKYHVLHDFITSTPFEEKSSDHFEDLHKMEHLTNFNISLTSFLGGTFSSNSVVNTMDMTAAIQYILTAAQSLGSQVYYKKSRMTILGLAGVIFCQNEQA